MIHSYGGVVATDAGMRTRQQVETLWRSCGWGQTDHLRGLVLAARPSGRLRLVAGGRELGRSQPCKQACKERCVLSSPDGLVASDEWLSMPTDGSGYATGW